MIVIDTSAVIAMLSGEPETVRFAKALAGFERRALAAANFVECALVLSNRPLIRPQFEPWLRAAGVGIVAVDEELARRAVRAFERFGKGRHPAGLNFGDCFAYALAKSLDAPLLFKGDDFAKTDVRAA
ncbi:MAG TPA: type II toxin-antitoxin system VapC family toxin [Rhizomicrobium sp.]|nr:type II toxin-antitoxin system VapC family toxin [Rhizomicrobium sp.]